jgi:hypothetical protein
VPYSDWHWIFPSPIIFSWVISYASVSTLIIIWCIADTSPILGISIHNFGISYILDLKGSPGAAVKLLLCDHKVMGSSPGNSLLQKYRERLRT